MVYVILTLVVAGVVCLFIFTFGRNESRPPDNDDYMSSSGHYRISLSLDNPSGSPEQIYRLANGNTRVAKEISVQSVLDLTERMFKTDSLATANKIAQNIMAIVSDLESYPLDGRDKFLLSDSVDQAKEFMEYYYSDLAEDRFIKPLDDYLIDINSLEYDGLHSISRTCKSFLAKYEAYKQFVAEHHLSDEMAGKWSDYQQNNEQFNSFDQLIAQRLEQYAAMKSQLDHMILSIKSYIKKHDPCYIEDLNAAFNQPGNEACFTEALDRLVSSGKYSKKTVNKRKIIQQLS